MTCTTAILCTRVSVDTKMSFRDKPNQVYSRALINSDFGFRFLKRNITLFYYRANYWHQNFKLHWSCKAPLWIFLILSCLKLNREAFVCYITLCDINIIVVNVYFSLTVCSVLHTQTWVFWRGKLLYRFYFKTLRCFETFFQVCLMQKHKKAHSIFSYVSSWAWEDYSDAFNKSNNSRQLKI